MVAHGSIFCKRHPAGFTLIEMMVVISVIIVLIGLTVPALGSIRHRSNMKRTLALIEGLQLSMAAFGRSHFHAAAGGNTLSYALWDLNGDGLLDGDPQLVGTAGFPAPALAAGYTGFVALARPNLGPDDLDRSTGRIVDAWGQPLRFRLTEVQASGSTGALSAGIAGIIFSIGRDGVAGTEDDVFPSGWKP